MITNFRDRSKASSIHFGLSALLISILLIVVLLAWFPNEFIYAGGVTGLKIIIGVDLILGPVLTFVAFNKSKKSLKFDLAFIVLIQLSCMVGGVWLMHKERPMAQVLADDGIHIMSQADFNLYGVDLEKKSNGIHPRFIILDLPEDWSQISAIKIATEFMQERPFAYRQDLYIDIEDVTQETFLQRVKKIQQHTTRKYNKTGITKDDCQWVPVISNHNPGGACITFEKGIVLLSNKNL